MCLNIASYSCSYLRNKVLPQLGLARKGRHKTPAAVVAQAIQVKYFVINIVLNIVLLSPVT